MIGNAAQDNIGTLCERETKKTSKCDIRLKITSPYPIKTKHSHVTETGFNKTGNSIKPENAKMHPQLTVLTFIALVEKPRNLLLLLL